MRLINFEPIVDGSTVAFLLQQHVKKLIAFFSKFCPGDLFSWTRRYRVRSTMSVQNF
jgi:hypothetical protein